MCDIVGSFSDKIVGCMVDQIFGEVKYLFYFKNNIQKLRDEIEDLKNKRYALQLRVDAAKVDEVTGPDVLYWLMKVDETNKQAEDVLEAMANLKWANIKSRYALSKKATEIASEILGLSEKGNFERVVYPAPQVQIPYAPIQDFGGFESRMLTRRQVLEALRDNSISVIGVCGMAGVGKTVMAKEIADRVKVDNIFEKVAMAVVSQNPDPEKEESKNQLIIKIQEQLADELKFTISEKNSVHARAERLSAGLRTVGDKGVLIILDDLWQDLDLKAIGISTIDQSEKLKVLLTSRFQNVCINTGAQKIFEVEVLKEEEAWHLFKETAVISDDATNVVHLAEEVTKQCRGLPLAIVTVAKALRNKKEENAWSDALEQLRNSSVTHIKGMHNFVYSRIEWSYNHLDSDDAKSVLLLCSLFPEDFDIPTEDLVRYVKGIQLFKNVDKMKLARDRVESVVHDLKDCYLLLAGANEKHVKLHDVVRDVCLLIASKKQKGYMVSNYGVIEGPQDDILKNYTAVSLTVNEMNQVPSNLDCSRIELLRLFCGRWLDIPMYVLEGTKELKVFHLQYVNIQSSLQFQSLISIRSLCLEYCKLNTNLSLIGGLQNLQILSFFRSELLDFPKAIETLSHLKSLNLRFKECSDPFPSGVLLGLKSLEELYLEDYMLATNDKEQDQKIFSHQHVTEMNSLFNLNMLQILTNDTLFQVQVLKGLHVEHMSRFYIGRTRKQGIRDYQFRKTLELFEIEGKFLADPSTSVILKMTENLILEVKGVKNFVNELDEDGFVNLRELKLLSGDYVYLIDAANSVSGNTFQNLEYLELDGLSNLLEISNGILPAGSFHRLQKVKLKHLSKMMYLWRHSIQPPSLCKLRDIRVSDCHAITSLFPQSILKCLVQLQELDIRSCQNLEEIVSRDETTSNMEVLELPKLKKIRIASTRFRSLCIHSGIITSVANERPQLAMLNRVPFSFFMNASSLLLFS